MSKGIEINFITEDGELLFTEHTSYIPNIGDTIATLGSDSYRVIGKIHQYNNIRYSDPIITITLSEYKPSKKTDRERRTSKSPKTIDDYNKESRESEVCMLVIDCSPEWKSSGIICPCCNNELLLLKTYGSCNEKSETIKCPTIDREGKMFYSYEYGVLRPQIDKIEWGE